MGTETEVVLITPDASAEVARGKAELTLLPAAHTSQGTYSRYHLPKIAGRLSTLTLGEDALSGIQTSSAITIRLGSKESYTIAIPAIAAGMHALETCQADLLRTWRIDPAERAEVVTPPKGNPGAFFGPDEYPPEAIRASEQGRTIAVALVAKTGSVEKCVVAATSGGDEGERGARPSHLRPSDEARTLLSWARQGGQSCIGASGRAGSLDTSDEIVTQPPAPPPQSRGTGSGSPPCRSSPSPASAAPSR